MTDVRWQSKTSFRRGTFSGTLHCPQHDVHRLKLATHSLQNFAESTPQGRPGLLSGRVVVIVQES
ncbi:hypothetical protein BT69DRAFT_1290619 [Atractiella rhizophila]|nr:hypothetical protein BT69DRAFT_1290619 [Atractiella rhizophila]